MRGAVLENKNDSDALNDEKTNTTEQSSDESSSTMKNASIEHGNGNDHDAEAKKHSLPAERTSSWVEVARKGNKK